EHLGGVEGIDLHPGVPGGCRRVAPEGDCAVRTHDVLRRDAQSLEHRQRHGHGSPGREHDLVTEIAHVVHGVDHGLRDLAVFEHDRAVDVERDEPGFCVLLSHQATGSMTSRPPKYGRSASGTRTEPSACWCVSSSATIQRVVASVPFSVATCCVLLSWV